MIATRFYNGLASPLTEVKISVGLRARLGSVEPPTTSNRQLEVVTSRGRKPHSYWPIGYPGVPFTVRVPVAGVGQETVDVAQLAASQVRGSSIQGFIARSEKVELVVQLIGHVPSVGEEMRPVHSYLLPDDLENGSASQVIVDHERMPGKWRGWNRFEQVEDVWIFGFGSLVDPDEFVRYVGYQPAMEVEWAPARLNGHGRAWNVGMNNMIARPDDKFYVTADNRRYDGIVVTLGVVANRDCAVNGVVFRVERRALQRLDRRERRYDRVDVSGSIATSAQLRPGSTVYTYIPTSEALAVGLEGIKSGTGAVSRSYYDRVERAFAQLGEGQLAQYRATTPEPTVAITELQVIRPGTQRHLDG